MLYVYHYCSYDTFVKIITNNTLRLSNIRNSNDGLEMQHQLKQYEEIPQISEYLDNADNGYWRDLYKYMKDVTEATECYTSCFSAAKDRLSQWERYSDGCKGVSICFDRYELELYFDKIAYDINTPIDDDNYAVAELCYRNISYKPILATYYPSQFADYFRNIKPYLRDCSFTKHKGFSEEKEFRVNLLFNKNYAPIMFDKMKNYIEENIYQFGEFVHIRFPKNLIRRIYLGPLCEKNLDDVVDILNSNEYNSKVTKSSIPYKPKYKMVFIDKSVL